MKHQLTWVILLFLRFSVVSITPFLANHTKKHTLGTLGIQIEQGRKIVSSLS